MIKSDHPKTGGASKKKRDVLVVGCGSIGQRRINLLLTFPEVNTVNVYTRRKASVRRWKGNSRVRFVNSMNVAVDCAFICNETSLHVKSALPLAARGIPLFIEKPLSHSLSEAERFCRAVSRRGLPVYIGYNLRFLGAIQLLRNLVQRGSLGRLWGARIEVGQYLPDWRPGRRWRDTYSARGAQGGGVALDLSHEVDYMRWLFGEPRGQSVATSRAGNLGINVDSLFEGIYRFKNGFLCSVHLDYLQKPPRRVIRINGSKGTVECDLLKGRVTILREGRLTVLKNRRLFDFGASYKNEMRHFFHCLKGGLPFLTSTNDGVRALELICV